VLKLRFGNFFSLTAILIDYTRWWLHETVVMRSTSPLRRLVGQDVFTQLDEPTQGAPKIAVFQLELLQAAVLVVAEEDLQLGVKIFIYRIYRAILYMYNVHST